MDRKLPPGTVPAMQFQNPTLVGVPANPALAFSHVVHESTPSPVVSPPIVFTPASILPPTSTHEQALPPVATATPTFTETPKNPPGLEPFFYPRAPIKRRRRRKLNG